MVKEIIKVYRERIKKNSWLQQATKEKAITKLNKISVHVGYPEVLPPYYDLYDVSTYEEGSNLVLEAIKFIFQFVKDGATFCTYLNKVTKSRTVPNCP